MPRRKRLTNVAEAQARAKRRLPRSVYSFIEGGTGAEYTVQDNLAAFREITFRPRAATAFESRRLATTVMGDELAMPVIVAPTGLIRIAHRGGEVAAARAAGTAQTAIGVSTLASFPIAEIAAATTGPVWYQVYFAGGREATELAIDRAAKAGCSALLVTVDLAAAAGRERSLRGGAIPTRVDLKTALRYAPEIILRPRWALNYVRDGLKIEVPNVRPTADGPALSAAAASASMRTSTPTWDDLDWIRAQFPGKVAVKGVITPDDARRAVDLGADAVIVSNHGGNALDGTPATLRVLPEVVAAVGARTEVLMDGGIRRGADVVKALALGARAVLIGRAWVWALAAAGEDGVRDILAMFKSDIDRTLALLGCSGVDALDPSYLDVPVGWGPGGR